MRSGDGDGRVLAVQTGLEDIGLYTGAPDGSFGQATRAAVVRFQQEHGLAMDGVAGPATMAAPEGTLIARARRDAAVVRAGVAAARRDGALSQPQAAADDAIVARTLAALARMRVGPTAAVAAVLHDVSGQVGSLDPARARALFGMLDANLEAFRSNGVPRPLARFQDADGVVYRYFFGHGYQFHPLATFAALGVAVTDGRGEDARRIARAMVARGIPDGRGLVWEYYFPFGGPARWTSGFAQAAAADALVRAGQMLGERSLLRAAHAALITIPASYVWRVADGRWIREYSFGSQLILNAQLQTFLLVHDYAERTGDHAAATLAGQLETAARRMLPQFDTGCWSRYSLGGAPASPHYHAYHVLLLRRMARVTGDPIWATYAARWRTYEHAGGCPP